MAKRQYIKRSEYWTKKSFTPDGDNSGSTKVSISETIPQITSEASEAFSSRRNNAFINTKPRKYSNIWGGMLNYEIGADGIDCRDAIELCQRAYANVAVFRLAIDTASELANDKIFLSGGNKKSLKLVKKWFKQIKLEKLKSQYFREYYRGGNVFLYKLWGRWAPDEYKKVIAEADNPEDVENKIVMRYALLNPVDIIWFHASTFEHGGYGKVLNQYELTQLKNATTDEEKKIVASLPPEERKVVMSGQFPKDGIKMKLDPASLITSFFKKQDYEPFAIPFGFPVLDDINLKLEMKKVDAAVLRTVDNIILLATHGNEPTKGGTSEKTLSALTQLLSQPTVGRTIVSDYTTKLEFIIPDLKKVIGKDKYEVVNEDIKQGLNLVFLGDDKYGSAELKMEAFLDKLEEAQNDFLNDFLIPEVEDFCKRMGLKIVPEAHFAKRTMKDESGFRKAVLRLIELGILDAKNGVEAIENGKMPNAESISESQATYVEERKKGYYNPIVGGIPTFAPPEAKGNRTPTKTIKQDIGRPSKASKNIHIDGVVSAIKKIDEFINSSSEIFKKLTNLENISESQKNFNEELARSVIECSEPDKWTETFESCIKDKKNILNLSTLPEILSLAAEHQITNSAAAILVLV